MRILFVTPEIRWPLQEGGHIRLWNSLQGLLKAGEVDVLAFQGSEHVAPEIFKGCQKTLLLGPHWLQFTPAQKEAYFSTLGRFLLFLGTAKPFRYLLPPNQALASWFARFVAESRYDVVWMARPVTAMALNWRDPKRTILDADNFDHALNYHLLRNTFWYGAKIFNYLDVLKMACWERQLSRWFARVLRCSREDSRRMPHRNVVVIPNGTHVPCAGERAPGRRLLFIGSLGYPPNSNGLEWFLRDIWPRVRFQVPQAEVDVIGGNPPSWLQSRHGQDGIQVHGFVRDLAPFWKGAAASVAPLRAGSGTRLKILESLAQGVPAISTHIGAQGLEIGAEQGILRTDEPEEFAGQCAELLRNGPKGQALGERGRQAVAARYDWKTIQEKIRTLVQVLVRENS